MFSICRLWLIRDNFTGNDAHPEGSFGKLHIIEDAYTPRSDICIFVSFRFFQEFSLTDLQLSQSESLTRKLRSDQRDRRLLGEEHRDGGRRNEAELHTSSTSPSPSTQTGERLLPFVPAFFLAPPLVSPSSWTRVLRFLPVESQTRRLCGSGLDDGDQESLSEDGGRMFSMGMGMGFAISRSCMSVWITPCLLQTESALLRDSGF